MKNENFKIVFFCLEKYFSIFSTLFLVSKYFCRFFLYKSKIFSGIQKSYLEKRANIIKLFKIKNPFFLHRFPDFRMVLRTPTPSPLPPARTTVTDTSG